MPNFSEKIQEAGLNKNSEFSVLAQAAIEVYYLIPYPNKDDVRPKGINRKLHGGLHVSSTAINLDMLIALYQKYKPELLVNHEGKPFNEQDIKLLKLAAIYHDSANTSEVSGEEKEHADNFRRDMAALGFSTNEIEPFAMAIQEKDGKEGKNKLAEEKQSTKSIYQNLIQSADCFDIIRVRSNFKKEYMDIWKDLNSIPGFEVELNALIQNHKATIANFMGDDSSEVGKLHLECEYAPNCYLAVLNAEKNMLLSYIVFECLKRGKKISIDKVDISQLSILDLYNRAGSKNVSDVVNTLLKTDDEKHNNIEVKEEKTPSVNQMLSNGGCFVRSLRGTDIDNELKTLTTNIIALKKAGIQDSSQLRDYVAKQKNQDKIWTPDGFRWRPCSFLEEGLPINFIGSDLAVLIDPDPDKGTIASHFYKINVMSRYAAQGNFVYEHTGGPSKDKGNLSGIQSKFREKDRRRRGIESDPNLHYFGTQTLGWSEVLSTYETKGIAGIIVGEGEQAAKDALLLMSKLGEPFRPFYRYSPAAGVTQASDADIIKQSRIGYNPNFSEIDELIQDINKSIIKEGIKFKIGDPVLSERQFDEDSTHPIITKTISCDLSGLDPEKAKRINFVLNNLKRFHPHDINDVTEVTAVNVHKENSIISVEIETLEVWNKEMDIFLRRALNEIREVLSQENSLDDANLLSQLVQELKLTNIDNIKCLTNLNELSTSNPLKYQFFHPAYKDISCIAWVKNGKPIIEFHYPNGKVVEGTTSLLPEIAKRYYQQKIIELNQLFKTENVATWLLQYGINDVQVMLVKLPGHSKSSLAFGFDLTSKEEKVSSNNGIDKLISLLNLQGAKIKNFTGMSRSKFKEDMGGQITEGDDIFNKQVLIAIPDIQKIDMIIQKVKSSSLIPTVSNSHSTMYGSSPSLAHSQLGAEINENPTIDDEPAAKRTKSE